MNARASVVAEADGRGGTRVATLRSEAPLVLRPTPAGVYLVGGAAGPVGGDHLVLHVDVGPGAALTMRSAAAALVFPGPAERPSVVEVSARVAAGGTLRWLTEPVVAVRHCRHEMRAAVDVETGGHLVWREELVVGRHDEDGGAVVSRMAVDVGGRPVLRHEVAVGGTTAWASTAVGAGTRAAGSVVVVDPAWDENPPAAHVLGPGAAVLPLAGPGVQVTALALDATTLRHLLERGLAVATAHPSQTGHEDTSNRSVTAHRATTSA